MSKAQAGTRPVTRALAYCRVSTAEQVRTGLGLDAQRDTVTAEATRRGWTVDVITDEGASGKQVNPGLRDALDQLATGRADALIVAKMDRLARSVLHASDVMERARLQGWDLVVCDLALDLSTPYGKAMANMLATFAELEREMIATRTREGLAAAKAKGKQIGRPRLATAGVVDRICREREGGASFGAIARGLTDDGILSPQGRPGWQSSTVRRVFDRAGRTVA
ncbi:recombinase family protein [Terrabacter sp. Root181]|uniref:recombinase family protein n=1 Tax=Terrabacter sp. Root181 TaxID=1736484 RepID=UPI0006F9CD41|nr:recombinase family protein [Terrabacter sp. Root181]KRB47581.1 recombinase RecB [Terrabacter sp. Root181]